MPTDDSTTAEPFDEGYKAGTGGKDYHDNPYPAETQDNSEWLRGWDLGAGDAVTTWKDKHDQ